MAGLPPYGFFPPGHPAAAGAWAAQAMMVQQQAQLAAHAQAQAMAQAQAAQQAMARQGAPVNSGTPSGNIFKDFLYNVAISRKNSTFEFLLMLCPFQVRCKCRAVQVDRTLLFLQVEP